MIPLNLYMNIPKLHNLGSDSPPDVDCNFTPYKIFIITTRLYPLIYRLLKRKENINIEIVGKYNKNRIEQYINIVELIRATPGEPNQVYERQIVLNFDQKQAILKQLEHINTHYKDYCLIDIRELYNSLPKKYPLFWYKSIIEYTGINDNEEDLFSTYSAFIQKEGIYLTFNTDPSKNLINDMDIDINRNYTDTFNTSYISVCKNIKDRLDYFYKNGAITLNAHTHKNLINNWQLIDIDMSYGSEREICMKRGTEPCGGNFSDNYVNILDIPNRLYMANWSDKRFAEDITDFLLSRLKGDRRIYLKVPNNWVKIHAAMSTQNNNNYILQGDKIVVEVENLVQAREIADKIDAAIANTYGQVLVLIPANETENQLFEAYAKKENLGKTITYKMDDYNVFSLLLNKPSTMSLEYLGQQFRSFAVDIMVKNLSATKKS